MSLEGGVTCIENELSLLQLQDSKNTLCYYQSAVPYFSFEWVLIYTTEIVLTALLKRTFHSPPANGDVTSDPERSSAGV